MFNILAGRACAMLVYPATSLLSIICVVTPLVSIIEHQVCCLTSI